MVCEIMKTVKKEEKNQVSKTNTSRRSPDICACGHHQEYHKDRLMCKVFIKMGGTENCPPYQKKCPCLYFDNKGRVWRRNLQHRAPKYTKLAELEEIK